MPINGPYEFKLAAAAVDGFVEDAILIKDGEWAWHRNGDFLGIYLGCPDCHLPMTVWRRYLTEVHGHQIDAAGNVYPSVLHSYVIQGLEKCGFHSIPTRLLGFVDKRSPA